MRVGLCCGALWCALAACDQDRASPDGGLLDAGSDGGFVETVDLVVCAPTRGPFTPEIDNLFLPLPPGAVRRLESPADGGVEVAVVLEVLGATEQVAGVTTRVVRETRTTAGEPVEVSRTFVVEAPDGTVCNFGADVEQLDGGVVASTRGSWRAGVDGGLPGILMPAEPAAGQAYRREGAPGVAEARATHLSTGEEVVTPAGTFADTLTVVEDSPLAPGVTRVKVYARGVGLVADDVLRLVQQSP